MKRLLLSMALFIPLLVGAKTEAEFDGILVYANGGETCYLLSETPTVTYNDGNAILTVNGKQVATLELKGEKTLVITYGKYVPTGINEVCEDKSPKVTTNGKYISGGKLIIIGKDGKMYDTVGNTIK